MAFGFEWDEVNTAKVAAHGLTVAEVELVFFAEDRFGAVGKKGRSIVYGTVDARFICVVWTISAERTIRVTTAYPVNPRRIKR